MRLLGHRLTNQSLLLLLICIILFFLLKLQPPAVIKSATIADTDIETISGSTVLSFNGGLIASKSSRSNSSGGSGGGLFSFLSSFLSLRGNKLRGAEAYDEKCELVDKSTGLRRPHKVLVAVSSSYIPVLLNWLAYFVSHCPGKLHNIYYICLDVPTQKRLLDSYGINCSHVFRSDDNHNQMWLKRAQIAKSLLDQNIDVFLNDIDALWLQNPYVVIRRHTSSDMVATRSSFPEEAEEIFGAAICMGFLYVKSSRITSELFEGLASHMHNIKRPDDQRVMNKLLESLGLRFDRRLVHGQRSTSMDFGRLSNRNSKFELALLPSREFPRICSEKDKVDKIVVVAHCLFSKSEYLSLSDQAEVKGDYASIKDASSKEKLSRQYGMWILKPSISYTVNDIARAIKPPESSAEDFIRSISL